MGKYLPAGYNLKFHSHSGEYGIVKVIGEGALAITYLTTYKDVSGRKSERIIKEYFPDGLDVRRRKNGHLLCAGKDREKFELGKDRFFAGGVWQNDLRYKTNLKNEITPLQGIYEGNNTLYLEVTPFEGKTYDRFDRLPLSKRMKICLAVAKSVRQYHRLGYLCLDLKPENIFVLTNSSGEIVADLIEFVDFDSIRSKKEIADEASLSFTRNWSAPEQNNPYRYKKISERTDIYTVGELVFWSVFGRHSADEEHRGFSKYPYDEERGPFIKELNRMEIKNLFTALFRGTLRSSAENRFASMDDVIAILEKISDELSRKEYVITAAPHASHIFVGRGKELREIEEFLAAEHVLFVCGIGGIGKSTLVRNYCAGNSENYDIIIYLQCTGSLQSAFTDDVQFHINTVAKREEESTEEYFYRKLRHLENLSVGKRVLFVLDNYNRVIEEELKLIMKQRWDVIVVSRREPVRCSYQVLNIDAISDRKYLYRLFELNLGREISEDEEEAVMYMTDKVGGHTLIVELLARQIRNSYLSISEAAELTLRHGFSNIAPEKVGYIKDDKENNDTIAGIITALFDTGILSVDKRIILKVLSLFNVSGVDLENIQKLLDLPSKDSFNELEKEGWAYIDAGNIRLHPVIAETVRLWQWEDVYCQAVFTAMQKLVQEIKLEDKKAEYHLAEEMLNGCRMEDVLCGSGIYRNLLYRTVMAMPRHREEYIVENTVRLLECKDFCNRKAVLDLYDNLVSVYAERGDFDKCYEEIEHVKQFVSKYPSHYSKAMYYDMLAVYYDAKLNGAYDYETDEEQKLLYLLMDSQNQTIYHIKRTRQRSGRKLLIEALMSKVCVLVRSNPVKKREIDRIFVTIKKLMDEYAPSDYENHCDYYMIRGWYYTYVKPDYDKTVECVRKAYKMVLHTNRTKLDRIDAVIRPSANMLLEWGEYKKAAERIYTGIRICDENLDVLPYARKRAELMHCLLDIYHYGEDLEKYNEIKQEIDKMDRIG